MTDTSGEKPSVRTLADAAHAQLRTIAEKLRLAEDADGLGARLTQHRAALGDLFAMEEAAGGFYGSLLEEAPEHRHRVELLSNHHADILTSIDALRAKVTAAEVPDPAWIRERVEALVGELDDHAARENSLIFDVFETDLGGAG